MRLRERTEEQEQRAVAQYLDMRGLLYCHVPNGGMRNKAEGGKLKAQGVKDGVPDILIFKPKNGAVGLAIELKRRTGGRLSPYQKYWLDELENNGWAVFVAEGSDAAIKAIENFYGKM